MPMRPQLLDSLRVNTRACFHALVPIGSSTVPRTYGYGLVHSPLKRSLLQSSFISTAAFAFRLKQLPTWVSALSRYDHDASTTRDSHRLATFRPQALSASRRLTPRPGARVYFIPQPIPGLQPVQGFALSAQLPPSSGAVAPSSLGIDRSPASGLPQSSSPTSRFCSMQSCVPAIR